MEMMTLIAFCTAIPAVAGALPFINLREHSGYNKEREPDNKASYYPVDHFNFSLPAFFFFPGTAGGTYYL